MVEDDRHLRFVLIHLLGQCFSGARIASSANGEEALAEFDRHGADIVVSDCSMPIMDGAALVRQLRGRSSTLPILMSPDGRGAREMGMAASVASFLRKLEILTRLTAEVGRLPGMVGDRQVQPVLDSPSEKTTQSQLTPIRHTP